MIFLRRLQARLPYRTAGARSPGRPATVLAAAAVALMPATGIAVTLEEAVAIAVRTHPEVQAADATHNANREAIGEARAGFFPTVDVSAAYGYELTDNPTTRDRITRLDGQSGSVSFGRKELGFTVNQPIFDGFFTDASTEAAIMRARAAHNDLAAAREQVAFFAASSYINVWRDRRRLLVTTDNVRRHQGLLARVRQAAAGGTGTTTDVNQASARLNQAISLNVQAQRVLRTSELAYVQYVGAPADIVSQPTLPTQAVPPDEQAVYLEAVDHNPNLKAARERVRAELQDRRASRAALMPTLSFEGGGTMNYNTDGSEGRNADLTALLRFRYNIFNGGADSHTNAREDREYKAAIHQEAVTLRLIEEGARNASQELQRFREQLPLVINQVRFTENTLSGYEDQYQIGNRTLLDLINTQRELTGFRIEQILLEAELARAHFQVLFLIGKGVPTVLPDSRRP